MTEWAQLISSFSHEAFNNLVEIRKINAFAQRGGGYGSRSPPLSGRTTNLRVE